MPAMNLDNAKSVTISWNETQIAISQSGDVTALELLEQLGAAVNITATKIRKANAGAEKPRLVIAKPAPLLRR